MSDDTLPLKILDVEVENTENTLGKEKQWRKSKSRDLLAWTDEEAEQLLKGM